MGLRGFFKGLLPEHHEFRQHRQLGKLGSILHDPNIFHLNRHSAAGGIAIGLFLAFMPVPGQTFLAALLAIYFHVNLPLAVMFVFVSNPLTIPPLFYICYRTGAFILQKQPRKLNFELSLDWFSGVIYEIWDALLLGCLLLGTLSAVIGYVTIRLVWRIAIVRKWEERKEKKRLADLP
ncbi:MAG: DUF2062 domain-containing protein [Gammaproteobacteria bacterium]|nr:DUF2062 domain-containing protein [Gammaproteobacteria bacterium]